jgi:hypothetical protein
MSVMNLPEELERELTEAGEVEAPTSGCACTLFAVVNANGTLARGFRAVSSSKLTTGRYQVIFNRDVSRCAFVATIGLSGSVGAATPGEITVVGRAGNPNGVFVTTHNSGGAFADNGFHLAVHCAP